MTRKPAPIIGRNFGTEADYENLRVEGAYLYWYGKKLRTVGWTTGEKLQAAGIAVSLVGMGLLALINIDKLQTYACPMTRLLCHEKPAQQKPVQPQIYDPATSH
jgi:hypothetical protein